MGRLRSARGQQGQTSAEYVGILAFVAAVVALVVMSAADIGATVVDKVQEAICTVTGGDCGDGVTAGEGGGGGDEVGTTDPGSGEDGGDDEGGDGEGSEDPDEGADPDDDEADPEIVEDATEDIKDELGDFWGPDYGDIADILEGLDPAEFNAVIANLDDDELERILAGMGQGFFGTDEDDRRAFFNAIAQKASPETLERLMELSEDLDPRFDDVENDGLDETDYEDLAGDLFLKGEDDNAIHPSDIDQQGLGDCYLLASLAEIAQQNPELIRDIIRPNDNGTFTVTFYDDGEPVEIVVGPHIPATDGSTEFAGPRRRARRRDQSRALGHADREGLCAVPRELRRDRRRIHERGPGTPDGEQQRPVRPRRCQHRVPSGRARWWFGGHCRDTQQR